MSLNVSPAVINTATTDSDTEEDNLFSGIRDKLG